MSKGWILLIAAVITSIVNVRWCHVLFDCGCTWLWAGADLHCNVHHAHGRHCPLCAIEMAGTANWVFIILAQSAVAFWPAPWHWRTRLLLTLLMFPVAGSIPGVVLGLWTGYWN